MTHSACCSAVDPDCKRRDNRLQIGATQERKGTQGDAPPCLRPVTCLRPVNLDLKLKEIGRNRNTQRLNGK